jgi:hypothetical protein
MLRIPLTLFVVGLIGLSTNPAFAQDAKAADTKPAAAIQPVAEPDLPPLEADPAFERYINVDLIGKAWIQLNSVMLTDAVLQLAEGERVLLREHTLIGAAALADIAVRLAAENKDSASLDRLAKFAASRDDKALSQQITAAKKTAGTSRRLPIPIDLEELTLEDLAQYKAIGREITRARLSQDVTALGRIGAEVAALEGFNPTLRAAVISQIASMRKLIATSRGDTSALLRSRLLSRLGSVARGDDDECRKITVKRAGYSDTYFWCCGDLRDCMKRRNR